MLQEYLKKKKKRGGSPGNGGGDANTVDLAEQVPDIEDLSKNLLNAMRTAEKMQTALHQAMQERERARRGCSCG